VLVQTHLEEGKRPSIELGAGPSPASVRPEARTRAWADRHGQLRRGDRRLQLRRHDVLRRELLDDLRVLDLHVEALLGPSR